MGHPLPAVCGALLGMEANNCPSNDGPSAAHQNDFCKEMKGLRKGAAPLGSKCHGVWGGFFCFVFFLKGPDFSTERNRIPPKTSCFFLNFRLVKFHISGNIFQDILAVFYLEQKLLP